MGRVGEALEVSQASLAEARQQVLKPFNPFTSSFGSRQLVGLISQLYKSVNLCGWKVAVRDRCFEPFNPFTSTFGRRQLLGLIRPLWGLIRQFLVMVAVRDKQHAVPHSLTLSPSRFLSRSYTHTLSLSLSLLTLTLSLSHSLSHSSLSHSLSHTHTRWKVAVRDKEHAVRERDLDTLREEVLATPLTLNPQPVWGVVCSV